jgi:hypothetical protein
MLRMKRNGEEQCGQGQETQGSHARNYPRGAQGG